MWRGLAISRRAPDQLGSLMAAGLTLWIVLEAFVNMAVMVGLLPFAGNALPFISAGGSNLVVSMTAIGVLLNISRQSSKKEAEIGRSLSAVVDLRGRKRRRSISRPRRASEAQR
jgi:cell division protein FtsW